ncbi:MAG: chorismate-binding protein [Anaerolineae bacterium]
MLFAFIYRSLRMLDPSPYMFFLRFPVEDGQTEPLHVIGASPEMMVRYEADSRAAVVRPIAGTSPQRHELRKRMMPTPSI